MLWRSWMRFTVPSVACALLALSIPNTARAGPVISFGGGVVAGGLLDVQNDPWAPMGWISVGGNLGDSWGGFARVGYERHQNPLKLALCMGFDCPSSVTAERRATYVPVSVGLRLSAPRPALSRLRAYVEAAASIAWSRQEAVVAYPAREPTQGIISSDHWLPGVELGAGFNQTLARGLGLECGLRYAYRGTPRTTAATFGLDTQRDGFSQVAVVAALSMGR